MKIYELKPTGTQNQKKNFYGKASVIIEEDGSETLLSYNTPIIKRTPNGELIKLYDGYTQSTGKHIKAFCGLNKQEFMNL